MKTFILLPFAMSLILSACGILSSGNSLNACPVTTPSQQKPTLPAVIDFEGRFWYGTPALWTNLPADGIWKGLPMNNDDYVQKTVFWRVGYVALEELKPDLTVSGRRLDSRSDRFSFSDATHGWDRTGDFMLMGISIPSEGCWEITAEYQDTQLTYVVEVIP